MQLNYRCRCMCRCRCRRKINDLMKKDDGTSISFIFHCPPAVLTHSAPASARSFPTVLCSDLRFNEIAFGASQRLPAASALLPLAELRRMCIRSISSSDPSLRPNLAYTGSLPDCSALVPKWILALSLSRIKSPIELYRPARSTSI